MDKDLKPRRFDRIKTHLQEHKKEYIAGAGGVAIGFVIFRGGPQVKSVVDAYKIQINSPTSNTVLIELTRRHNPGIKTLNTRTGEAAASISRMAEIDEVSVIC